MGGFIAFTVFLTLVFRFIDPPFTFRMASEWIVGGLTGQGYQPPHRYWRPLVRISPQLQRAVLAGEDQRFVDHHGFDFVEIGDAAREIASGGRIRGASTISMQTARTVFCTPDRTVARKLLEAYFTVLIEALWGKRRILEVYLNTVDWGYGIRGAEAAARHYFHSSAARLSPEEAALLAAVLPNPHRWSPTRPDGWIQLRQRRILFDMPRMPVLR